MKFDHITHLSLKASGVVLLNTSHLLILCPVQPLTTKDQTYLAEETFSASSSLLSHTALCLCISISVSLRPHHIMTDLLYIKGPCPCVLSLPPPSSGAFINLSHRGSTTVRAEVSGKLPLRWASSV